MRSMFVSLAICVCVGFLASVLLEVSFVVATAITIAAVLINGLVIMISEK